MSPRRHRLPNRADTHHDTAISDAISIVVFTERWMPYGGPDSFEILVAYGLSPAEFGRRLTAALDVPLAVTRSNLTPEAVARQRIYAQHCTQRPWPPPVGA